MQSQSSAKIALACPVCGKTFYRYPSQRSRYCSYACNNRSRIRDVEARFWEKVDRTGDCWIWNSNTRPNGYGLFWVPAWGKTTGAHRFAYILTHGSIPHGRFVCHTCDNPTCVRPSHLFAGTHAENMRDMKAKGRTRKPGTRTSQTKATPEIVRAIRSSTERNSVLAKRYGLANQTVSSIKCWVTWRHVT